jgi:hypothetical protein
MAIAALAGACAIAVSSVLRSVLPRSIYHNSLSVDKVDKIYTLTLNKSATSRLQTQEIRMKDIRPLRVALTVGSGVVLILAAATAYRQWQSTTQGWCVRSTPDAKQQVFYGDDCRR